MVQWLGRCTSAAGTGSIPGRGTKIPHATWRGQKKKKEREKRKKRNMFLKGKLKWDEEIMRPWRTSNLPYSFHLISGSGKMYLNGRLRTKADLTPLQ